MSNKVKLPKAVCDALDSITTYADNIEIVHLAYTGACDTWDTQRLSQVNPNTIMRALVLGYEPEITAEEQIKDLYFLNIDFDTPYFRGFREGVSNALRIHGIKYDWLEGDAE